MRWQNPLVVVCLFASACGGSAEPRPRLAARAGKQAVFGDASLVPTRAGERARRELAIAGELERALTRLEFGAAQVDVELEAPVRVVVIAQAPPTGDAGPASEATVAELCRAVVPELAREHLHVWLGPSVGAGPDPSVGSSSGDDIDLRVWAMLLTCVGLGLSLGVIGERLRARW